MDFVRKLVWDTWNVAHIARHEVTPEEVEQVCHSDAEVLQAHSGRILVIGPTRAGRMLAVVLAPEGDDIYFPVTARPASRKERAYYAAQRLGKG